MQMVNKLSDRISHQRFMEFKFKKWITKDDFLALHRESAKDLVK